MSQVQCALYARVSSESQTRDNTIASQITALQERIAAESFQLEPDHSYVDEGYSGSILSRPALERLRDAIAGGHIERIYVLSPDRLARRYAHQVLREVCRRLQQMGCQTRRGSTFWYASTIRSMLDNPAYVGRATFGRSHFLPPRPRLRPIRGHLQPSPRATSRVPVPREEWIEIPVLPLVDPTVFDVV